jgi:hypothetical protein
MEAPMVLEAGPFGTITVQEDAGSLLFTETVANGFFIHNGNGNHNALSFNLASASGITINSLSSGFQQVSGSVTAPPFGAFSYAIDCTSCAPGINSTLTSLSFTATANVGALTLASLSPNLFSGQQIYFASDLVSTKAGFIGNTGNVGATLQPTSAVPEPATWAMFIGGFGLVGGAMRRRQRTTVSFA